MNDEIKKLYDLLVREGKYTKSFDEFQSQWSDNAYKEKVYGVVSRDGFYTKDMGSFMQKYGGQPILEEKQEQETAQEPVKKKEVTPMASSSETTSLASQEEPVKITDYLQKKESQTKINAPYQIGKEPIQKEQEEQAFLKPRGGEFANLRIPTEEELAQEEKKAIEEGAIATTTVSGKETLTPTREYTGKETTQERLLRTTRESLGGISKVILPEKEYTYKKYKQYFYDLEGRVSPLGNRTVGAQDEKNIKRETELKKISSSFDNFKEINTGKEIDNDTEAKNFYLYYLQINDPEEYKNQTERLEYNKDNPLERQRAEVDLINKGLLLKQKALSAKSEELENLVSDQFFGYKLDVEKFKEVNNEINSLKPKIDVINNELSKYPRDENGNIITDNTNRKNVERLQSLYNDGINKYENLNNQKDELLNSGLGNIIGKAQEIQDEEVKNYEYAKNLTNTIKESDKYPELKKKLIEDALKEEKELKEWEAMPEWMKAVKDVKNGFQRAGTGLLKGLAFLPKLFGEKAGYGWTDRFAEFSDEAISTFEKYAFPISPESNKNIFDYEKDENGKPILDKNGDKIEVTNWLALPYQIGNGAGNLALFAASGGGGTAIKGASILGKLGITSNALSKAGTFAMGYTLAAKNNYDEAKANGMSESDAITYSKYKSIVDGGVELIFPEQKLLTPAINKITAKNAARYISQGVPMKDAVIKATKEMLQNVAGENVEELTALASDYASKVIAEKATGTSLNVDDNLMNDIKNTVLVTSIITAPFGIVGARGSKNQIENQSIFLAANKPNDVLKSISNLLDSKVINEDQARVATDRIRIASQELKSIPQDLSDDKKANILSGLVDKRMLENEKKNIDPIFHDGINAQIKEKEEQLKKEINRPDNGLTLEENDQLNTLTKKQEEGTITEQEKKSLDYLTNFTKEYAVQKQTAGQVPVQPTTGVGKEMEGGEPQTKPEVIATETIQEQITPEIPQEVLDEATRFERELGGPEVISEEEQVALPEQQKEIDAIEKRRKDKIDLVNVSKGGKPPIEGYEAYYKKVNDEYNAEIDAFKKKYEEQIIAAPKTEVEVIPTAEEKTKIAEIDNQIATLEQEKKDALSKVKEEAPKVEPQEFKLNVQSTTKKGGEVTLNEDKEREVVSEGVIVGRLTDENNNSFTTYKGNTLLIRIPARDVFGRRGGGTFIDMQLPENFNKDVFAKELATIKHEGNQTDAEGVRSAEVVKQVRAALEKATSTTQTSTVETEYNDRIKKLQDEKAALESKQKAAPTGGISVSNKSELERIKNDAKSKAQAAANKEERTNAEKKVKIIEATQKAINTLKSVLPDFDIVVHENEDSFNSAMKEVNGVEGSAGNFAYSTTADGKTVGRIDINLSKANERTVAHEVTHGILLKAFGEDVAKFNEFRTKLSKVLSSDANKELNDFAKRYIDPNTGELLDVNHEEFLAELTGMLSNNETSIAPTTWQKIAALINEFVSKITAGKFTPFTDTKNTKDTIDFFNTISGAIKAGAELEDINSLGLTGNINSNVKSKSSLVSGEIKRFPINQNIKLKEDVQLSEFNGKKTNLIESDRMVGGFIADAEGNPMFKFFGGVYYPIITGKWWASRNKTKAKSIAENGNKNRDEDGYIYSTPMIGSDKQHMSNNDMLFATIELMKNDALGKNSKVKKNDVIDSLKKAFDRKDLQDKKPLVKNILKKSNDITSVFNELEFILFQEGDKVLDRNGNEILDKNNKPISTLSFEQRLSIVETVLGDPKVKDVRFPSAGSITIAAKRFEEPITEKAKTIGDMVVLFRTKGKLEYKESDKSDPFYHKSYPVEVYAVDETGNPAEIEVYVLKDAYSMKDVLPQLTKSSGGNFSWDEYISKHKKEKVAVAQYNRTAKLSSAAGKIQSKSQMVAVAPYFNTQIETVEDANKLRQSDDYKKYKESLKEAAAALGFPNATIDDNIGGYENESGEKIIEISNKIDLKNATIEEAEEFAAISAAIAPQVQEASIALKYVKENSPNHNANEYSVKVDNIDKAIEALNAAEIYNFSIDEKNKTVSFINVFKYQDPKLEEKIGKFVEELESKGVNYEQPKYKSIESRYVDKGERKKILRRLESQGSERRRLGKNFRSYIETSITRDAEFQGTTYDEYIRGRAGNRAFNKPLEGVDEIADGYYKRAFGKQRPRFKGITKLNKERSKKISGAFIKMKHAPNDLKVRAAYNALAKETIEQYKAFLDAGYSVEINNKEPYSNSQAMIDDLRNNKQIKIFSTESGFGDTPITEKQRKENPLLAKTNFKDVNGIPLLVNDLFRAVHDFFGHSELGNSFGPLGEENAWNVHARMFSPLARKAMTTETRGQNSYVNFSQINEDADKLRAEARKLREEGKIDEANKISDEAVKLTTFAEQKIGLLPDEFTEIDLKDEGNLINVKSKSQKPNTELNDIIKKGRASGYSDAAIKIVLKKKGFTDAEVNAAMETEKGAAKKVTVSEEMLPGFDRMMEQVEGIVTKSKERGVSEEKIADNVMKYVMGSKAYENATDVQREQIIRDIEKRFGIKQKAAPSAEKILGIKDTKKITISEKDALKNQIKSEAKGAKNAVSAWRKASAVVSKMVKDMRKSGKITLKQATTALRRFSSVNVLSDESIERFVDYMSKVFSNAEYAERISNIKSKLPNAKKNIKTKLGIAEGLMPSISRLFNINPNLIPDSMLDKYEALVNMMGAREGVLRLDDINDVTKTTNEILDEIDAELSLTEELADRFDSYTDKVIKDDKLDYAATIEAMVSDGTITEKEAELMKKYKSEILPKVEKPKMTEEEIQEEKELLIDAVKNSTIDSERLASRDERDLAKSIAKLTKTKALDGLTNSQLKDLLKLIDNINNGYIPHYAQLINERMNAINNAEVLKGSIDNAKPLSITKILNKVKSFFTKKNYALEMIRRNPLAYIDQVFGDFKTKNIFNSLFEKLSEAQSKMSIDSKRIEDTLNRAQDAVAKSFKFDANKTLMSKFKMMTYLIQLEYESNVDSKQVNKASDFIKATIKHIEAGKSQFGERDAQMLQKILDQYSDANGDIDLKNLYSSFNQAEKEAIGTISKVNQSLRDKAIYTATIIRGQKINPLTNYVHLNVLHEHTPTDVGTGVSFANDFNNSARPSTKAKSLIERTGKVSPLNFDVFASAQRGANFVLTDYYLTEPIRTARKTLNETEKLLEQEGKVSKLQRDVFNSIDMAFEEAVEDQLVNNFTQNSFADEVVNYISKTGYRAILASATRFVSELSSNIGYALVAAPKDFATGVSNRSFLLSSDAIDFMKNVGSKQITRIFPTNTLSGKMVDTNTLSQASGIKGGKSKNYVANKIQQIYNLTGKKYVNTVELIADSLVSTPDKMVMRPIWFGSFINEFKNITGKDVDFKKIVENNEAYMSENSEAIDKAKKKADEKSVLAGATDNSFMGVLKGKVKPNQSVMLKSWNMFNGFMTKFMLYEYVSARTAVMAAMGNGSLSRRQGAAVLAGVTTRMMTYTLLTTMLSQALVGLFSDEEEEEEDEKSLLQKFGQSFASAVTSLLFGRDLGNASRTIINYGVEKANEKYLDFLREGEYDPYKDAIQYTIVPTEKKGPESTDLSDLIKNMMGPFSPAYKTADLAVKTIFGKEKKEEEAIKRQQAEKNIRIPLEIAGNLGLIPLYKDIRKVVLNNMYSSLRKEQQKEEDKKEQREKETQEKTIQQYQLLNQLLEDETDPDNIDAIKSKINELNLSKEERKNINKLKKEERKNLLQGYDNIQDMKRYNPKLYEENFGPESEYGEKYKEEFLIEKSIKKLRRKMKDEEMEYVPQPKKKKQKEIFGSESFGSKGFGNKGFGNKGF